MSVYRVLDKLEAYVHEGTWLPAGYRVLSEERLLELVEKDPSLAAGGGRARESDRQGSRADDASRAREGAGDRQRGGQQARGTPRR